MSKNKKIKDAFPIQTERNLSIIRKFLYVRLPRNALRRDLAFYRLFKLGYDYSLISEMATDAGAFVSLEKVCLGVGRVIAFLCMQDESCPLRPLAKLIRKRGYNRKMKIRKRLRPIR